MPELKTAYLNDKSLPNGTIDGAIFYENGGCEAVDICGCQEGTITIICNENVCKLLHSIKSPLIAPKEDINQCRKAVDEWIEKNL